MKNAEQNGLNGLVEKIKFIGMALCAGILMFQLNLFAELVEGRVMALDPIGRTLGVEHINPATGEYETISIAVPQQVEFKGVNELNELQAGDRVKLNAFKNEMTGIWEANIIEKG